MVAGIVRVKNPLVAAQKFPTNSPFTFTCRVRVIGHPPHQQVILPMATVRALGYPKVEVDLGLSREPLQPGG
jgi:hypothetical protein